MSRWTRPARVGGVERRGDLGDHRAPRARGPAARARAAGRAGRCRRSGPWSRTAGRPPRRRGGSRPRSGGGSRPRSATPRRSGGGSARPGRARRDHLQRDDVVERQVGRPVDDAHAAPAGEALDPVAGEHRPALKRISHGAILRARQAWAQAGAPTPTSAARRSIVCRRWPASRVDRRADQAVDAGGRELLDPRSATSSSRADQRGRVDELVGDRRVGLLALAVEVERPGPRRRPRRSRSGG